LLHNIDVYVVTRKITRKEERKGKGEGERKRERQRRKKKWSDQNQSLREREVKVPLRIISWAVTQSRNILTLACRKLVNFEGIIEIF